MRSEITLSYWITQIMTSFKCEDIICKRGDKLQYVLLQNITSELLLYHIVSGDSAQALKMWLNLSFIYSLYHRYNSVV